MKIDNEVRRLLEGHYWHQDLAKGIKDALGRREPTRIAVHSEAQAELGRIAARRMAPSLSEGWEPFCQANPDLLTFELIPDDEQDIYFVGAILV